MSKTIECIDKKIEQVKESITDFTLPLAKILLKKELQTLEQIKCELEAWEVLKKYVKEVSINGIAFEHIINVSYTKQNYDTVKKALEVEDENNN